MNMNINSLHDVLEDNLSNKTRLIQTSDNK